MGILRTLSRIFKGKSSEVEEKMMETKAYWDGMLKESEEAVNKVNESYKKSKATLDYKLNKKQEYEKAMKVAVACANEAKEKYKETKDDHDKEMAKVAFNKIQDYKTAIQNIEEEISALTEVVNELKNAKDNANAILNDKRRKIEKAKSQLEFSKTIDELTSGMKDLKITELEGEETISKKYFKSKQDLEEIKINNFMNSVNTNDSDFEKFMESENDEKI